MGLGWRGLHIGVASSSRRDDRDAQGSGVRRGARGSEVSRGRWCQVNGDAGVGSEAGWLPGGSKHLFLLGRGSNRLSRAAEGRARDPACHDSPTLRKSLFVPPTPPRKR